MLYTIRILGKFSSILNTVQTHTSKFPHLKKIIQVSKLKIQDLGAKQGQLEKKELVTIKIFNNFVIFNYYYIKNKKVSFILRRRKIKYRNLKKHISKFS